jgi:hypothetical protein
MTSDESDSYEINNSSDSEDDLEDEEIKWNNGYYIKLENLGEGIKIKKSNSLKLKEFTIQFWIFHDLKSSMYNTAYFGFNKQNGWDKGKLKFYFSKGLSHYHCNEKFRFIIGKWDDKNYYIESKGPVKKNEWVNYAITFNKTNGLKLYINGRLDSENKNANKFENSGEKHLIFGYNKFQNNVYQLIGKICEIKIFKKERDIKKILNDMNFKTKSKSLVLYFNFKKKLKTNDIIKDYSGKKNHGKLIGKTEKFKIINNNNVNDKKNDNDIKIKEEKKIENNIKEDKKNINIEDKVEKLNNIVDINKKKKIRTKKKNKIIEINNGNENLVHNKNEIINKNDNNKDNEIINEKIKDN